MHSTISGCKSVNQQLQITKGLDESLFSSNTSRNLFIICIVFYMSYSNRFFLRRRTKELGVYALLGYQITVKTEVGKSAKQSAVKLEHRMKDLAEIIKYAEQYKTNRSYHIAYKKSKNPDAYFCRYESQLNLNGIFLYAVSNCPIPDWIISFSLSL